VQQLISKLPWGPNLRILAQTSKSCSSLQDQLPSADQIASLLAGID
jgi:hypothetical protein